MADRTTKKFEIFEREFLWEFQNREIFEYYEALFGFHYGDVINGLLQPLKTPFVILNPMLTNGLAEIPLVIRCKSLLDIDKNGLYCEICCSELDIHPLPGSQYEDFCTKCARIRRSKYFCKNTHGACPGMYCMRCSRKQAISKIGSLLWCSQGHQLHFERKIDFLLRSEQLKSSKCDLCQAFTESYFWDSVCSITICQECSAEFILK